MNSTEEKSDTVPLDWSEVYYTNFYVDVEDTYEGIKPIDMVPNLSPQNRVSVAIGKVIEKESSLLVATKEMVD